MWPGPGRQHAGRPPGGRPADRPAGRRTSTGRPRQDAAPHRSPRSWSAAPRCSCSRSTCGRSATCRWCSASRSGSAVDRRLGRGPRASSPLGQVIISTISLKADLSNAGHAQVHGRARPGRDRADAPLAQGVPRRQDPLPGAHGPPLGPLAGAVPGRGRDRRLPDPAGVLPGVGGVAELARPRRDGRRRAAVRRGQRRRHLGRAVLHLHRCWRCCGRTSRSGWPTCCRRRCSCRSCGSWATASGGRC